MAPRRVRLLLAVLVTIALSPRPSAQQPEIEREPGSPLLTALQLAEDPPESALRAVPSSARSSVEAAIARAKSYRPKIPVPANADWFEMTLAERRQRVERALVSLVPGAPAEKEAVAFASQALLAYEWEGFSDPPLGEATHTEEFLQRHPSSVLRPGIELLQLYRYRAAFEAAGSEGNAESRTVAATKYVTLWDRMSRSDNLAVRAVAQEIDTARYLYIADQGHPRR